MKVLSVIHGSMIIAVEHRGGEDGGPSLRLLASLPGTESNASDRFVEIWRADCFKEKQHQHCFGPTGELVEDLRTLSVDHSIALALRKLRKIKELVGMVGYPEFAMSFSCTLLPPSDLAQIATWMKAEDA